MRGEVGEVVSLGGRPSLRRARAEERRRRELIEQYEGDEPNLIEQVGLWRVSQADPRPRSTRIYESIGSEWPILGLLGFWALAIWRIVATIAGGAPAGYAIVWSILIVGVAIVGTVLWWRAGKPGTPLTKGKRHS